MREQFQKQRLPSAKSFYEHELGRVGRPNQKDWAQANCRFHRSQSGKSFAVNLTTGAFICFGCGVRGGDVVDYVKLRDGCSFVTAARSLDAWSDKELTPAERVRVAEAKAERQRQAAKEQAKVAKERKRRFELCDEIRIAANIYREANDRLTALQRGAEEFYPGETEMCWELMSLALDELRRVEVAYIEASGLTD